MSQTPAPEIAAFDDTRARLLALEMVTVAALNRLLGEAPALKKAMLDLGDAGGLPDRPEAGDRAFLEHVQTNVARLATSITTKL